MKILRADFYELFFKNGLMPLDHVGFELRVTLLSSISLVALYLIEQNYFIAGV